VKKYEDGIFSTDSIRLHCKHFLSRKALLSDFKKMKTIVRDPNAISPKELLEVSPKSLIEVPPKWHISSRQESLPRSDCDIAEVTSKSVAVVTSGSYSEVTLHLLVEDI